MSRDLDRRTGKNTYGPVRYRFETGERSIISEFTPMVSISMRRLGENIKNVFFDPEPTAGRDIRSFSLRRTPVEQLTKPADPFCPSRISKLVADVVNAKITVDDVMAYERLEQIDEILECRHFSYRGDEKKSRCRGALLALWNHLLRLIDARNDTHHLNMYHKIIEKLLDRPEFGLDDIQTSVTSQMEDLLVSLADSGDSNTLLAAGSSSDDSVSRNKTMNAADKSAHKDMHHYRRLLVSTFKYAARRLGRSDAKLGPTTTLETRFYARVFAVAFARIPVVQEEMEAYIDRKHIERDWLEAPGKLRVCKWSGPTFAQSLEAWSLENGYDMRNLYGPNNSNSFTHRSIDRRSTQAFIEANPSIYGWVNFVPYIDTLPDDAVFAPVSTNWLDKVTRDGEFFFYLVCTFTQHIAAVAKQQNVLWAHIPGYAILSRIAVLLVKEASWRQWWDMLSETDRIPIAVEPRTFCLTYRGVKSVLKHASTLLMNPDMMNMFVLALYESTNLHESRSVGLSLHHLEAWLTALAQPTGGFPSSFDPSNLIDGLKLMLRTENFESLKKVLLFLYNALDVFTGPLRQEMLKLLLGRHFQLFLHWNFEVRAYYHHILVYKISHLRRNELHSVTDKLLLDLRNDPEKTSLQADEDSDEETIGSDAYTDRAHWKAFDACVGLTCLYERTHAKEIQSQLKLERASAANRAIAFRSLRTEIPEPTAMNERRPGPRDVPKEMGSARPDYYLRYLPPSDLQYLNDLCSILTFSYPKSLQVYVRISLREYTRVLAIRYERESHGRFENGPALGFC